MNGLARDVASAILVGVILPAIIIQAGILIDREKTVSVSLEHQTEETVLTESTLSMMFLDEEGNFSSMGLDEYLVGAVLGEMPADFELEALKAQAVAARTYAWKTHLSGVKHDNGAVCGNYACCQAYISEEQYLANGGLAKNIEKIRTAVLETSDLVLTYDGNLIEATYFSCSGGKTEDAVAVWGNDFPYLRSVESPGEEHAVWFTDEAVFDRSQLETALGISLPENPENWFGEITYTNGGGVETIRIGDELFSGTKLRGLLRLRSTAFEVTVRDCAAVFHTRGYGHRVGMSQYGADAMAVRGADYTEILAHYYPGTALMTLEQNKRIA